MNYSFLLEMNLVRSSILHYTSSYMLEHARKCWNSSTNNYLQFVYPLLNVTELEENFKRQNGTIDYIR